ncbi:microfibrillar-associated protein 1-like protein [Heterostelium album PN500]|uniref:Microfibrillar-associated protein 1-like protein n=1 Tax=Heterostelium pallidum (strain ATCC 26659 / Pp 5 / PN500) TaxID=670386 RepID=D3BD97_HETP5|nr:microfibrillar-associated protein 1-like protein [Heterostelium album PN500]EFA80541.1 microfibrillar-associated protein 1-like protein [Heterostelium album PN500]|eukprot:XP_020432661.1 microfibrillar-associated protein 1-like protein [Heterostelium album PN500]
MSSFAESVRNKLKQPKVARYRAGQVPDFAKEEYEEEQSKFKQQEIEKKINFESNDDSRLNRLRNIQNNNSSDSSDNDRVVRHDRHSSSSGDRSKQHSNDDGGDDKEERVTEHVRRRVVHKTEIVEEKKDNNKQVTNSVDNEADNDDDLDTRRQRAREKYLKKKQEEEKEEEERKKRESIKLKDHDDESDEEGSEDEDEESDDDESEEDESWGRPIVMPVFIAKEKRGTIKTDEMYQKEEEDWLVQQEREKEQRKLEAHRKLKEELERDEAEQKAANKDDDDDDDDDADEDGSRYDAWVQREINRLKKDIRDKLVLEREQSEKLRRSKMTDKEIEAEDAEKLAKRDQPKQKLKFMQRDYHRGAFFQDDEYIKNKDFSGATGEDKFNRELLPKIMQVKNFGKGGRTKYTHLADQDTSKGALWNENQKMLQNHYNKLAGR